MLINLHVKNIALLREVDVEFDEGLNILTGETGAGKSLLIGSVNMALGRKVSKELISDDREASVQLVFDANEKCREYLDRIGISVYDDNQIIITRKVVSKRTVSKINGENVTLNDLKKIMSFLVDVHGQHEHQSLLYKAKHLEILDEFAKNTISNVKDEVRTLHEQYKKHEEMLKNYSLDDSERLRQIDLIKYEIHEIENAHLVKGEDEELENAFKKLQNANNIIEGLSKAYNNISVGELFSRAIKELSYVSGYDEQVEKYNNRLIEADCLVNDLMRDMSSYIDELNFDFKKYDEISKRLDVINHLKTKYNKSIEEILDYSVKQQELLLDYTEYDNRKNELMRICKEDYDLLENKSCMLSKLRKKEAKALEKQIVRALCELNFVDVKFEISFKRKDRCAVDGFDDVEFLISTNPGEGLKPLAKIASGGELSRIMLALKSILAGNDNVDTLIFDEIDTGISGRTAQLVAEKLNLISKSHQVICITHLPQIAAMADTHFLINKEISENETKTEICKLDEEESVNELARILGGAKLTDMTIAHAREMKNMADKSKNI